MEMKSSNELKYRHNKYKHKKKEDEQQPKDLIRYHWGKKLQIGTKHTSSISNIRSTFMSFTCISLTLFDRHTHTRSLYSFWFAF